MSGEYGEESYRKVEYWDDIVAFEPYKCLCYAENNTYNCIYNERRNDVLPPKPDDVA